MKKYSLLGASLLLCVSAFAAGCRSTGSDFSENGEQAFTSESEADAVNTLQVGTKYRVTGPMDELKDAVVEILGENYWPDTILTKEELAERTGISDNMYEDFLAEYQHTEAGIDMMILVKTKENETTLVEDYLNDYREMLLKIYEQQPQNKAKVFASRIETIDNYVCYVQLGADISALEKRGEDEMVSYCQQENERALDILEKRILNP